MMSGRLQARIYFLIALLLISACSGLPKSQRPEFPPPPPSTSLPPLPAPVAREPKAPRVAAPKTVLLDHKYFKVYYDPDLRLPRLVVYTLTAEHLREATTKRHDSFRPDPLLMIQHRPYVDKKEYVRSGYDKGHMAPFKDFAWSVEGGNETFVLSNMVPQKPKLNQQAWEDLEEHVREWACGEEKITVMTGPLIDDDLPHLTSGLTVPKRFFKILIDETPPKKMLAFVYNQTDSKKGLTSKRVARADDVAAETHLDMKKMVDDWDPALAHQNSNPTAWKSQDCVGRGPLQRLGGDN